MARTPVRDEGEAQSTGPLSIARETSYRIGGAESFLLECISLGIDVSKAKSLHKLWLEYLRVTDSA